MRSIASPVISTSLYFVVFSAAIDSRVVQAEGVPYGAFIVPGLRVPLELLRADVSVALSAGMALVFLAVCMVGIWWICKTGYRLRA
jgi:hypothetical protein